MVSKKRIRDFENYTPPSVALAPARIWGTNPPDAATSYLHVDLYCLAPQQEDPFHFHPDGVEIILCLQGRARVSLWPQKVDGTWDPHGDVTIEEGDSVLVPVGALHRYVNVGVEGCLLIVMRTSDITKYPKSRHDLNGKDAVPFPAQLKLRIRDFEHYNPNHPFLFVRERIWGRNNVTVDGLPDPAKDFLHMNIYCIAPEQENPLHYHPNSIELVMCLQGKANVTVRDRNDDGKWEPARAGVTDLNIEEGDTVMVPKAALHRYVNTSKVGLLLIALQTPHAILHLFEDEVGA
jgi:quercetin dioxygenase-like cupin family protein